VTNADTAQRSPSWRATSLVLVLLAIGLPIAARTVAGPRGAIVHVRWQESLAPAARQSLESAFRLTAAEQLDDRTWRYELIDPSIENLRSLVRHQVVEDTQGIDRTRYSVDSLASRTARHGRFPVVGNMIVVLADRLAALLAASGALLVWLGVSGRAHTLGAARTLVAGRTLAFANACRTASTTRWASRGIPDVDASVAGIFRILFGLLVLVFFLSHPEDARSLNATFNPIVEGDLHASVLDWLRARPFIVEGLAPWLLITGVAFTIGLATRVTYTLFVAGVLVWAFVAAVHDSTHPNSTLVLTLVALLPSRWGDARSVDAWWRSRNDALATERWPGKHYGYSVWVPGLVFGVAFAAAAWAKVVGTGPRWIVNGSVKYHFITDSVNAPVDWGLQLAGYPQIAVLASLGAVVAEALVITAAFSRNEWYRLGVGVLACGLLAGFWLFMGVFWPGWWILLLGFVPWSRLTTWFRRPSSEPVVGADRTSPSVPRIEVLPSVGQLAAIVFVVSQQFVVSSLRIERAPMFTYYPMYSSTYDSPEQFDASMTPYYRIMVSTGPDRIELTCNAPGNLVRAFRAALDGSTEATSRVWREVHGCRSGLEAATNVIIEGDRRVFDWDHLTLTIHRSAIVLGPLPAVQAP